MRYRGLPGAPNADATLETSKRQRVSTKLVLLLSVVVLLFLFVFVEWADRTKFISRVFIDVESGDGSGDGKKKPSNGDPNPDDEEEELSPAEAAAMRTRPVCPRSANQVILLFPHVNKAGGRTIEGTFDSLSNPKPQFAPLTRASRSGRVKFQLVDGHRDYDEIRDTTLVQDIKGQCFRWIFMMRDPVARTLSAFNTMVGREDAPSGRLKLFHHFYCDSIKIQTLMKNPNFTFEEFASLPEEEIKTCQKNYHVRYLAGKSGTLERAKRRLQKMAFVGIAEEFALSMQLLNWELDVDLRLYTPVFNKNLYEKDDGLSERARKVLRDLNEQDIELYEYGKKEIYDVRIQAMKDFYGGLFPWKDPATCDPTVVCWDKRMRFYNSTWPFAQEPPAKVRLNDPGSLKENVLCAPEQGCTLALPEIKSTPPASSVLPPPLKVKSESLCMASVFIVGARKGGTTSLYQYFSEHPNFRGILLDRGAQSGETFFFETRAMASDDTRALPPGRMREMYDLIYAHEFRRHGWPETLDAKYYLTGESSVGMGPSCYSPRVLKETCGPKQKIIYLLRDPVDRMLSQYQMRARLKRVEVEANFTADSRKHLKALTTHPDWKTVETWYKSGDYLSAPPPCLFTNDYHNSLWSGFYLIHLARWFRQYDVSNIMILQSEAFFKDPKQVFLDAMNFVQLDASLVDAEDIVSKVFNAAPSASSGSKNDRDLDSDIIRELQKFFLPFNQALTRFLQERQIPFDFKLWKSSHIE